jgi:hypothetical protein
LEDGSDYGVDLSGGWFDAGDVSLVLTRWSLTDQER